MENNDKPEVWLRGPLPHIPPLLQPAAHALLQAQEEINKLGQNFPAELLWIKPAGLASVGFHMQHLAGVLDRLLTYARGESLSAYQLDDLKMEQIAPFPGCEFNDLLQRLNVRFDAAIFQLEQTDSSTLLEVRMVGRAQIPSTHLGLIFHAAEHTMRHLGQLLVTMKFVEADFNKKIEG